LAWQHRHGWPGGLDVVELLQQSVALRRGELDTAGDADHRHST
jgi:hypothetical protein